MSVVHVARVVHTARALLSRRRPVGGRRTAAWAVMWIYLLAATLMPLAHAAVAKFEHLPVTLCSAHGTGVIVIPLKDPAERKRIDQSMSAPACCGCAVLADLTPDLRASLPNAPALLGTVHAIAPAPARLTTPLPQRRARAPPQG